MLLRITTFRLILCGYEATGFGWFIVSMVYFFSRYQIWWEIHELVLWYGDLSCTDVDLR